MEIERAIRTRRAIRKYDQERSVSDDVLYQILEAGRLGPSSKNSQPVRFVVVRDKDKILKLSEMTYTGGYLPSASVAVAVITKDAKLPEIDAARAVQNMVLRAWDLGVGTCWITNFWEKGLELLGVPMNGRYRLITVLPFGYPHPDVSKPKGKRLRKSLDEVVSYETLGNPWTREEQ